METLTYEAAQTLTREINAATDSLYVLVKRAHEGKAWQALGYLTWTAYVEGELEMSLRHSERLLNQGRVIAAIHETIVEAAPGIPDHVVGSALALNEVEARRIKPHLAEVVAQVKQDIAAGVEPAAAVKKVVNEYGLPTPKEADALYQASGLGIVGSDNRVHRGMSKEERQKIVDWERRIFSLLRPIETLASLDVPPTQMLAEIPPYMHNRITDHLGPALQYLLDFKAIWEEHHAD